MSTEEMGLFGPPPHSHPRVLVIGAAGFIGSRVVTQLERLRPGATVAGYSRSSIDDPAVDSVRCDLMDPDALRAAMRGVDVVVNCARSPGGLDNARAAARNLVGAASSTGVSHIIYLSSIAVYGAARGPVDEDMVPRTVAGYGHEKLVAEAILNEAASEELAIAILRPGLVYGPGGVEWVDHFITGANRSRLRDLDAMGEGDANLVYVDDLAAFCVHLTTSDIPSFSVCNVVGDTIPHFNAYFAMLAEAAGIGTLAKRTTSRSAWDRRRLMRRVIRKVVGKVPIEALRARTQPGLLDDAYDRYASAVRFATDRARSLGFTIATSLEEGVRSSVAAKDDPQGMAN